MRSFIYCIFCLGIFGFAACSLAAKKEKPVVSPPGYDFSKPETIKLPEELDEISGMVYMKEGNRILALNDEEGRIYEIALEGERRFRNKKFMKGGDFEDLCLVDSGLWALKSNGQLVHIRKPMLDSQETETFRFNGKGFVDFETLIYLPQQRQLVLLCKECRDYPNEVPGFMFDIDGKKFIDTPGFRLDFSRLPDLEKPGRKEAVRPSAGAIHPVTREMYILASANHLLIVADSNGYAKNTYRLDRKVYKQPEGICFTPDGSLYISNEARAGSANIRKLAYKP